MYFQANLEMLGLSVLIAGHKGRIQSRFFLSSLRLGGCIVLRKYGSIAVALTVGAGAFAVVPPEDLQETIRKSADGAATLLDTSSALTGNPSVLFADFPIQSSDYPGINARGRLSIEVPLDAAADVLELERFAVLPSEGMRVVDNATGVESFQSPEVALFRGSLRGNASSSAFLSVSPTGTYGFVRMGEREFIISSGPPGDGGATLIFDPRRIPAELMPFQPFECGADLLPILAAPAPTGDAPRGVEVCRTIDLAIETDQEFLGLFGGNVSAAGAYIATLVGAVSEIYQNSTSARFRVVWSRLWTGGDPWDQGDTSTQLQQFRSYWNANMTGVPRHAVHMLSGRNLGGGIAYLNALCGSGFDYGLSANLDGFFPYPIQHNHPLNWDLMVVAHELGHNCGAPHTHNMSPPADCCGGGYTPNTCGNVQDCSAANADIGTIMSYCHICPGGMSNMRMEFHTRTIAETILPYFSAVSGSCGLAPEPPAIQDQPDNLTVAAGGMAQFSVVAENGWPLSYQWRKGGVALTNGGAIGGATSATLTISPVNASHIGTYDVVVTPACGSAATSAAATLGVCGDTLLYVNDDAAGTGDGSSWANAFPRLQDALTVAQTCPTVTAIWVADGTYRPDETNANPNGNGDRNATFQLRNNLSIIGGFRGQSGDEGINNGTTRPLDGTTGRPVLETQLTGDLFENDGNASAIPLGPVGNWLFDAQSAGVTPDETSNILDATLLNGASLGAGVHGTVLSLTAEGQYARVSHSSLFSFTNDFSVAFWVKAEGARPGATLIDKSHGASNGLTGWAVQSVAGDGELRFAVGTGTAFPETSVLNALDNSWHHICFTVSGTPNLRVRGYRDGTLVNDVTHGYTTIATNAGDLFFGRHFEIPDRMFVGELDGIALFARAINDNEVAKLANPSLDNSFHVLTSSGTGTSSVVDGVTVTRGNASDPVVTPHHLGAGLRNVSPAGSPTIRNCRFYANRATVGAGIYNGAGSNPAIENCSFEQNLASTEGGGIYNTAANPTISNCGFIANAAGSFGGAIYQDGGTPTLRYCEFRFNTAAFSGGAINNHNAFVDVAACVFRNNHANGPFPLGGGAIAVIGSAAILRAVNSQFIANHAVGDGGAIRVEQGGQVHVHNSLLNANSAGQHGGAANMSNSSPQPLARFCNCTFSQNSAGNSAGGAIHIGGGPLTVVNSILWGNTSLTTHTIYNSGGNVAATYSDIQGLNDGGVQQPLPPTCFSADPLFADADGDDNIAGTLDDDFALSQMSACIDAANNVEVPTDYADLDGDSNVSEALPVDLLGNPRFSNATCISDTGIPGNGYAQVVDMGAYEYVEPDCDNDGIGDPCDSVDFIEITAQPQSQTACAGDPVAFGVNAVGAPPISYQWRRNGIALIEGPGSPYGGVHQNVLLVNPASSNVAGSYDVEIIGACGIVFSDPAILTVTIIPGDINESGEVDIADLTTLLSSFGTLSGASFANGDLDGDGDVDLNDLTSMLSAFGSQCM